MTREEAINFLKGYLDEEVYTEKCRNAHEMAIKALEQEPKTGHWIGEPNNWLRCSECGKHYPHTSIYKIQGSNYCPNCGAKMESEG